MHRRLRLSVQAIFILAIYFAAIPVCHGKITLEQAISRIEAANGNIRTMTCDFVSVSYGGALRDSVVTNGKIRVSADGELYMTTNPGKYDEEIFTYSAKDNRIGVGTPGNITYYNDPTGGITATMMRLVSAGTISKNLSKDFNIGFIEKQGRWIFDLTPRKKAFKSLCDKIRIYVTPTRKEVEKVELTMHDGTSCRYTVSNIRKR